MRTDEPLLGRKLFPPISTSDLVLKMLLSGRMNLKKKEDGYLATGCGQGSEVCVGEGRGRWTIVSCNNGSI